MFIVVYKRGQEHQIVSKTALNFEDAVAALAEARYSAADPAALVLYRLERVGPTEYADAIVGFCEYCCQWMQLVEHACCPRCGGEAEVAYRVDALGSKPGRTRTTTAIEPEEVIYCANCDAEATCMAVHDAECTPLCYTCKTAYEWGQAFPHVELRPLDVAPDANQTQ